MIFLLPCEVQNVVWCFVRMLLLHRDYELALADAELHPETIDYTTEDFSNEAPDWF